MLSFGELNFTILYHNVPYNARSIQKVIKIFRYCLRHFFPARKTSAVKTQNTVPHGAGNPEPSGLPPGWKENRTAGSGPSEHKNAVGTGQVRKESKKCRERQYHGDSRAIALPRISDSADRYTADSKQTPSLYSKKRSVLHHLF